MFPVSIVFGFIMLCVCFFLSRSLRLFYIVNFTYRPMLCDIVFGTQCELLFEHVCKIKGPTNSMFELLVCFAGSLSVCVEICTSKDDDICGTNQKPHSQLWLLLLIGASILLLLFPKTNTPSKAERFNYICSKSKRHFYDLCSVLMISNDRKYKYKYVK